MLCTSRYPLELHLVHRNIHDDTVQEALTHENGMTVLGFKFKIVDDENVDIVFNSLSSTWSKNDPDNEIQSEIIKRFRLLYSTLFSASTERGYETPN